MAKRVRAKKASGKKIGTASGKRGDAPSASDSSGSKRRFCRMMKPQPRPIPAGVGGRRLRAILVIGSKWPNGMPLKYYFFTDPAKGSKIPLSDGTKQWRTWAGAPDQRAVVRRAFDAWKALGIGLEFEEVKDPKKAHFRIGFQEDDGSWSSVGRDCEKVKAADRTMNFGWDITVAGPNGLDTAIHEVGHALGLEHEHQNPFAGIVWNVPAVYTYFAGHPNYWSEDDTDVNVLDKIVPDKVQGSTWDRNSIMHYEFEAGLIERPVAFAAKPLIPAGGLSTRDRKWVKEFYPPLSSKPAKSLSQGKVHAVKLDTGGAARFAIRPERTAEHELATSGMADTILDLFEKGSKGHLVHLATDDDSGHERNARIRRKLTKGREYVLSLRVVHAPAQANLALSVTPR